MAEPPVVDVHNARVQQVFRGAEVADLPTTRDIAGLLLLVPSLTSERGGGAGGVCSGGIGLGCDPTVPPSMPTRPRTTLKGALLQGRILVDGMVINAGRTRAQPTTGRERLDARHANAQEVSFTLSGHLGRV